MPLEAAKAANFGKPRIVIHAHLEVRIAYARALVIELIGEAEHARVARQLERCEIEVTVRKRTLDTVRATIERRSRTSQPRRTKLLSYSVIRLTKLPGRARHDVSHH